MNDVGPPGLNWLPGISRFAELNVRTLLHGRRPRGGLVLHPRWRERHRRRSRRPVFHLPYSPPRSAANAVTVAARLLRAHSGHRRLAAEADRIDGAPGWAHAAHTVGRVS